MVNYFLGRFVLIVPITRPLLSSIITGSFALVPCLSQARAMLTRTGVGGRLAGCARRGLSILPAGQPLSLGTSTVPLPAPTLQNLGFARWEPGSGAELVEKEVVAQCALGEPSLLGASPLLGVGFQQFAMLSTADM